LPDFDTLYQFYHSNLPQSP